MTEVNTTPQWQTDLTAKAVSAAKAKAVSIDGHCDKASREYGLAALELELVYRHWLKGDKDRLASFCEAEVRGIKASMAYQYVQAGRVLRDPEAVGLDKDQAATMAVKALAQFDRFLAPGAPAEDQAEAKAEAVKLIETETAKAVTEGRKALTSEGLIATAKEIKAEATGEPVEDPTERRTGNIAAKLKESYRSTVTEAYRLAQDGQRGGFFMATAMVAQFAAEAGATHGAVTPAALARIEAEWLVDRKTEAAARIIKEKKAEAEAKDRAKVQASIETLRPAPAKAPAPAVKAVAKAKAPAKRTSRKAKAAGGTAALVAANAPADGQ